MGNWLNDGPAGTVDWGAIRGGGRSVARCIWRLLPSVPGPAASCVPVLAIPLIPKPIIKTMMRITAMLLARRCIGLVRKSSSPGGRVVLAIVRSELAVAAHRWLRTVVAPRAWLGAAIVAASSAREAQGDAAELSLRGG